MKIERPRFALTAVSLLALVSCSGESEATAAARAEAAMDSALAAAAGSPELGGLQQQQWNLEELIEEVARPYGGRWVEDAGRRELWLPPDVQLGAGGLAAKEQVGGLLKMLAGKEAQIRARQRSIAWESLTPEERALIIAHAPERAPAEAPPGDG